ncbi:MAG: PQQ-like beta-propeller repeat protein [Methanomassiliicoccales archaeon]|nr:PQQ-like beta-propeller repeat protein [Methanomassiliicoccales archaeon]
MANRGPWPMLGGNAQHTGLAPVSLDLNSVSVKWNALSEIQHSVGWISPAIGEDGTIYAGDGDGVMALDSSGKLKWRVWIHRYPTSWSWSPGIGSGGNIHVGSAYGLVTISNTGQFVWNFTTATPVKCPPTVDDEGRVYFGQYYGPPDAQYYLYCVLPNGTLAWRHEFGPVGISSPAIGYDGIVYAVGAVNSSYDSPYRLAAFNPNGTLLWEFDLNSSVSSSPVVTEDTIYIGCDNARFYAIGTNGSLKWVFEATAGIKTTAAIAADGTIYFGSDDGCLYSLSKNGFLNWAIPSGILDYTQPVIGMDGTVLFGNQSGLVAVSPNGTVKWHLDLETWVYSPAIGEDGTIYVGTWQRGLIAIGPASGVGLEWYVLGVSIGIAIVIAVAFAIVRWKRSK